MAQYLFAAYSLGGPQRARRRAGRRAGLAGDASSASPRRRWATSSPSRTCSPCSAPPASFDRDDYPERQPALSVRLPARAGSASTRSRPTSAPRARPTGRRAGSGGDQGPRRRPTSATPVNRVGAIFDRADPAPRAIRRSSPDSAFQAPTLAFQASLGRMGTRLPGGPARDGGDEQPARPAGAGAADHPAGRLARGRARRLRAGRPSRARAWSPRGRERVALRAVPDDLPRRSRTWATGSATSSARSRQPDDRPRGTPTAARSRTDLDTADHDHPSRGGDCGRTCSTSATASCWSACRTPSSSPADLADPSDAGPARLRSSTAFAEMYNLRAIAGLLVGCRSARTAGRRRPGRRSRCRYTLALPSTEANRWRVHRDLLDAAARSIGRLRDDVGRPATGRTTWPPWPRLDQIERGQVEQLITAHRVPVGRRSDAMIRELRILPPLAIARFGAAADADGQLRRRRRPRATARLPQLRPAETLEVDERPARSRGRSCPTPGRRSPRTAWSGRSRRSSRCGRSPTTSELEPLTAAAARPATRPRSADVRWRVQVANLKVFRRTGDEADRVEADSGEFTDHARARAGGARARTSGPASRSPSAACSSSGPTDEHPEIRLRFTPGAGIRLRRQPHRSRRAGRRPTPTSPTSSTTRAAAAGSGTSTAAERAAGSRCRASIYAGSDVGRQVSRGTSTTAATAWSGCALTVGGGPCPPSAGSASDRRPTRRTALPIRTVADELEQALLRTGPCTPARRRSSRRRRSSGAPSRRCG